MNTILPRFSSFGGHNNASIGSLEEYEGYNPEVTTSSNAVSLPKFDIPATDVRISDYFMNLADCGVHSLARQFSLTVY